MGSWICNESQMKCVTFFFWGGDKMINKTLHETLKYPLRETLKYPSITKQYTFHAVSCICRSQKLSPLFIHP